MVMRACACLVLLTVVSAGIKCPHGQFVENTGDSEICANCVAGQYNHLFDSGHCFMCPAGKFQAGEGQGGCEECPVGYYSDSEGFESCTACQIGKYGAHEGASANICVNCPPGKFGQPMPASELYRDQNDGIKYTINAPVCSKCPDGKYNGGYAQTECKMCRYPQYSRVANTLCSKCERGEFLYEQTRTPSCQTCASAVHYLANEKKDLCPHCDPGKYQIYKFGESYHKHGFRMVADEKGAHSEQTKAGECYQCPQGKWANSLGSELCEYCPQGYFSNKENTGCVCKSVDCVVAEWGEWTTCSRTCGGGRKLRTRNILQSPNHCFETKPCPHLVQQQSCNTNVCESEEPEETAAPTPAPTPTRMKEGDDWTSTCSHVYCTPKAGKLSHIVHHKNNEMKGWNHHCEMHLHKQGKCGCECSHKSFIHKKDTK